MHSHDLTQSTQYDEEIYKDAHSVAFSLFAIVIINIIQLWTGFFSSNSGEWIDTLLSWLSSSSKPTTHTSMQAIDGIFILAFLTRAQ